MAKKKKKVKIRSEAGKALSDPSLKPKVVKSRKHYTRKGRSPLDRTPPKRVLPPRYSNITNKYIIECPNGEKLEYASREAAWKDYHKLKWEF